MTLRPAFITGTRLSESLPQIGQLANGSGSNRRKNAFDSTAHHLAPVELAGKRLGQDADLLIKFLEHLDLSFLDTVLFVATAVLANHLFNYNCCENTPEKRNL